MNWTPTPYALPPAVGALLSALLSAHALRRRGVRGARAFAVLMAGVCVWCLGNAAQAVADELAVKMLLTSVQYFGIALIPASWLALTLEFAGRGRLVTRRLIGLVALPSLATLLSVLTNGRHHLFWREVALHREGGALLLAVVRGPLFWLHIAWSYGCLAAGALAMLPRLLSRSRLFRAQTAALVVGLAIPWLVNVGFVLLGRRASFDPTPSALALTGVAFAWGLFRYGLLDLTPVARERVTEGMPDGMLVVDAAGRLVDLNPSARQILGVSGDPVGRAAQDLLGPWPEAAALLARRLPGEAEAHGPDGRTYAVSLSPLLDEDDQVSGLLVLWRDVSEAKRVEAELRQQKQLSENLLALARATSERTSFEATLRRALEVLAERTGAAGSSLFLLDETGAVTYALKIQGPDAHRYGPQQIAEIMSRGVGGWVLRERRAARVEDTLADPRWLPLPDGVRSALAVPIESGPSLVGVLSLVHAAPGHFGEAELAFLQAAGDQLALALRNAQIFDERSRLAERQTLLYEVLRAVGATLDPRDVARVAVGAISERTRWPVVEVALPSEEEGTWSLEARSRIASAAAAAPVPLDLGVVGRAFRTRRSQRVPDVSADPDYVAGLHGIRSELAVPIQRAGRGLGVLNLESDQQDAFSAADVALAESLADAVGLALESARLYRALSREHERLRALERTRDDLTRTLVHDLRNPLTAVSGALDLVQASGPGGLSPNVREMLPLARRSAARMEDLIDSLLEVSRLQSGQVPLAREPLAIADLVGEALALQAALAAERGVALCSEAVAGLPAVMADARLLRRVLQNLLHNALKFTPAGGHVRVSAGIEPGSEPPLLRVCVADDGPGVAPELAARLFGAFVTGDANRGSGLGLALCRLAVEAQGGRIWLDPGDAGARFVFTLPVAPGGRPLAS